MQASAKPGGKYFNINKVYREMVNCKDWTREEKDNFYNVIIANPNETNKESLCKKIETVVKTKNLV